ncbi:MAG: hypothetical protein JWQ94_763, partial [Tardiphaga sp.]|nr:hypothetical protein [Tardiphaga sp.]
NSAVILTKSSAATQQLSTVVTAASEETSANVQSVGGDGRLHQRDRAPGVGFQPDRQ